jgi:hypothetical protein
MDLEKLKKFSQKPHVLVAAGAVLTIGLFVFVFGLQQRQDVRSRAAAGGCDNVMGDIEADNCQISGNVVGNIKGNNNNITGNVYGFIIGDFNTIGVNVGKSIFGNNNTVGNNVYGCVAGNNNTIENNVSGSMTGTGNSARQVVNLPCPPFPSNPPSQPPSQPPTLPPSQPPTEPPSQPPTQPPSNPPSQPPSQPPTLPPSQPPNGTCDDNIDNNENIVIDEDDPICHTDGNPNNPDSYDPRRDEGYPPSQPPTQPPTLPPGTSISLTVFMHGIGSSGDNVNPNNSSLSNKNPKRIQRLAEVYIYGADNELVASTSGEIRYNNTAGNYTGTVRTQMPLASGIYNIRVGADQHLTRLIPTIQTIVATGTNVLPPVSLVAGDIIRDNTLNILDYNILIGCYDDAPAPICGDTANKTASDLDDNGAVNGADYNLFLREILTQPGQ